MINLNRLMKNAKNVLKVSFLLINLCTALHPSVVDDWYVENRCTFYQNQIEVVLLCNEADLYSVPRYYPYNQDLPLINSYDPGLFNLDGDVRRVFTD